VGKSLILLVMGLIAATPLWAQSAKKGLVPDQRAGIRQWELVFPEDTTQEEYARQLDYFKIEIAAVSRSNKDGKIEYITHVSDTKPQKRIGQRASEERLQIGWKSGTLHAVDRRLLTKAGISSNQKDLQHYFPLETQKLMEVVERAYAGRDPHGYVTRTQFGIRATKSGGYEFEVLEQDPPPDEKRSKKPSKNAVGDDTPTNRVIENSAPPIKP